MNIKEPEISDKAEISQWTTKDFVHSISWKCPQTFGTQGLVPRGVLVYSYFVKSCQAMYLFYGCGQTICSHLVMLRDYKHVAAIKT